MSFTDINTSLCISVAQNIKTEVLNGSKFLSFVKYIKLLKGKGKGKLKK